MQQIQVWALSSKAMVFPVLLSGKPVVIAADHCRSCDKGDWKRVPTVRATGCKGKLFCSSCWTAYLPLLTPAERGEAVPRQTGWSVKRSGPGGGWPRSNGFARSNCRAAFMTPLIFQGESSRARTRELSSRTPRTKRPFRGSWRRRCGPRMTPAWSTTCAAPSDTIQD